jgi:hypothetical protein
VRRALLVYTSALLWASIGCKGGAGPRTVLPSLTIFLDVDGGVSLPFTDLLDAGIDFGTVPVLVPSDRKVVLGNNGGTELTINSFAVDGGAFSLLTAEPTKVPSGGNVSLPLRFMATAEQTYQGSIRITSDDPTYPDVQLALIGRGFTVGALTVIPDPISFGAVGEGTSQIETVTLKSTGTTYLAISDIALASGTDPAFSIISAVPSPDAGSTLIDAGSFVQIALQFSPVAGTPLFLDGGANVLLISSSDPNHQPNYSVPLVAQTVGAPVPLIGDPGIVPVGALVTLDGGASYDPGGLYPLTYAWTLLRTAPGSQSQLSSVTVPFPQILADRPGDYRFSLSVTNDAGVQSLAPAFATLHARPSEDIYVELVWVPTGAPNMQSLVDLDLHFLDSSLDAGLNGPYDCFWANRDPGFDGGPFQAVCSDDQIVGPGPEWAGYANPPGGSTYAIAVNYFASHGQMLQTDATVRVFIYGILEAEFTQTLSTVGQVWWVADVNWPWTADGGIVILTDAGTPP